MAGFFGFAGFESMTLTPIDSALINYRLGRNVHLTPVFRGFDRLRFCELMPVGAKFRARVGARELGAKTEWGRLLKQQERLSWRMGGLRWWLSGCFIWIRGLFGRAINDSDAIDPSKPGRPAKQEIRKSTAYRSNLHLTPFTSI